MDTFPVSVSPPRRYQYIIVVLYCAVRIASRTGQGNFLPASNRLFSSCFSYSYIFGFPNSFCFFQNTCGQMPVLGIQQGRLSISEQSCSALLFLSHHTLCLCAFTKQLCNLMLHFSHPPQFPNVFQKKEHTDHIKLVLWVSLLVPRRCVTQIKRI